MAKSAEEKAEKKAHGKKLRKFELRQKEIDLAKAEASLWMTEQEIRRQERNEAHRLSLDSTNHVYHFSSGVYGGEVESARESLLQWSRQAPGSDLTVVFNSPGGSVFDGFALFDLMRGLSDKGHNVTTVCHGYAASMGGILLQAGDHRVMGPESYLMLHEVSYGAIGKAFEIQDVAALVKRLTMQACEIYARRAKKLSADEIYKKLARTDWWVDAKEALKLGFVDEVA